MQSVLSESAVEALEEVTAGKVLLILLGVGALGGIVYLATRPKAAASAMAPGSTTTPPLSSTTPPPNSPPPTGTTATFHAPSTVQPLRPTPPSNTFSSTPVVQVPPGVSVTVAPGAAQTLLVAPGGYVTLNLPAGANWKGIGIGQESPERYTPVALDGDTTSPVSIALSTMVGFGYDLIAAQWIDSSGKTEISFYKVAAEQKPLTLHV